jgi:hypothetical protein
MAIVAACIVVGGLVYIAILLPLGKLTATTATAVMVGVLAGALVVAVVVPNTSGISHLIVKAGQYFSLSVDMQQAASQVRTDTTEVRQINEQIKMLAKRIEDASSSISQTAHSVAQTQANIRGTCQAMFEMAYLGEYGPPFMVEEMPSPKFMDALRDSTSALLRQCFDTNQQRVVAIDRLNALMGNYYRPSPKAVPTPTTLKPN